MGAASSRAIEEQGGLRALPGYLDGERLRLKLGSGLHILDDILLQSKSLWEANFSGFLVLNHLEVWLKIVTLFDG